MFPRPQPWLVLAAAAFLTAAGVLVSGCGSGKNTAATAMAIPQPDPNVPPFPVVTPAETGKFVGSEACRSCHPRQFRELATSRHSDTLHPIDTAPARRYFKTDQRVQDRVLGVSYTVKMEGETPICRVDRSRDGAKEEMTPRWIIGSGRFGHTLIFERGGKFMESRISYYPELKRWDWTPGQQDQTPFRAPMGAVQDPMSAMACFGCHSTMLVREGEQLRPELSRLNIGCERCHGPGKEHAEQAKSGKKPGAIYGYRTATALTEMHLCGECHRQPGAVPDAELETHPDLPRFAGTALAASRCYRESEGRLKCTTCHNPHQGVSHDLAAYDKACKSCHAATAAPKPAALCPVNKEAGCVKCHMKPQAMGPPVPELKFTHHWIRIY